MCPSSSPSDRRLLQTSRPRIAQARSGVFRRRSGRALFLKSSLRGAHQSCGARRSVAAQDPEGAPALLVVGDEEMLDLLEQVFWRVLERVVVAVGARFLRDADQTVVAARHPLLGLLRLQD